MPALSFRHLLGASALAVGSLMASMAGAVTVAAPAYSGVYFFGDSLSDTGNTQALFAGFGFAVPNPADGPYAGGRFSDGPVWTEFLAAGLGHAGDAASYLAGGRNYAFGGARTTGAAPAPIPGVLFQAQSIWGASATEADAGALYVVVGGGNDMRDAREIAQGSSPLDLAYRQIAAENAVANLQATLGLLAQRGAQHVLVSNLPDLGKTPEAVGAGLVGPSTDATNRFNALMPGLVGYGQSVGLTVTFFDMAGAVSAVRANPASFGITNLDLPCAGFAGADGGIGLPTTACSASAFSDTLHPSSRAHELIAGAAFQALGVTPVPEPQTVALMLAGLALVGTAARRRQARAAA